MYKLGVIEKVLVPTTKFSKFDNEFNNFVTEVFVRHKCSRYRFDLLMI